MTEGLENNNIYMLTIIFIKQRCPEEQLFAGETHAPRRQLAQESELAPGTNLLAKSGSSSLNEHHQRKRAKPDFRPKI